MSKRVFIKHLGRHIILVPREQLRRTTHGRTLRIPYHLKALASTVPTPPTSFDASKGRMVKYPMWDNDRYGDCYEEDALHCILSFIANAGKQVPTFDAQAVLQEYLALSGGDNGLGDNQVFPHWKNPGFQGHEILDDMTVDPTDDAAIRLGLSSFCGGSWTCALPDAWIVDPQPGDIWDAGTPNPQNGHAMALSGYVEKGQPMPFDVPKQNLKEGQPAPFDFYSCETWGFDPPILLTPAGMKSADPEVTVQHSLEMYDANGIAPFNNTTYDGNASLWSQLGGQTQPPSPFGPPGPTPTPTPPVPTPPPTPTPTPPVPTPPPTPTPPPPTPTPQPPTPTPTPAPPPDVVAKVDALFEQYRHQYRRNERIVSILTALQTEVYAVLTGQDYPVGAQFGLSGIVISSEEMQILDAALKQAAAAHPQAATLLDLARAALDQYLPLL